MKDFRKMSELVKSNEDIHGAGKDWKGYDPDIPEPFDFIDEMLDEIDGLREDLTKSERRERLRRKVVRWKSVQRVHQ